MEFFRKGGSSSNFFCLTASLLGEDPPTHGHTRHTGHIGQMGHTGQTSDTHHTGYMRHKGHTDHTGQIGQTGHTNYMGQTDTLMYRQIFITQTDRQTNCF